VDGGVWGRARPIVMELDVVREFRGLKLGDWRREQRVRRIVEALQVRPAESFPKAMATRARREAFYRLVENEEVTFAALFAPHAAKTAERCVEHRTVLVIHDTTKFSFDGEGRSGLGKINSAGQGFLGHFSIAVSADGKREPLGALAVKTWSRPERGVSTRRKKGELSQADVRKSKRESARWYQGVAAAEEQLEETRVAAVHVMDSEGDDYLTFALLAEKRQRFVVRGYHDRLMEDAFGKTSKVKEFVATSIIQARRSVKLSPRKKQLFQQKSRKRAQSREGRETQLAIRAEPVDVRRPTHVKDDVPKTLTLNVVHVREVDDEVLEPVDWLLYTTEPIDTREDILRIVDIYRARWVVEEFFKALKTGCAFEKRQLESMHTLENALALFIPMAWGLLRLRVLAREHPELSAAAVLTPTQITILRKKKLLSTSNPSAQQAMLAVAALGGHIVNNGSPGWIVLGRGYEDLLMLEAGFLLASARNDQS
jgi:IS4 transposase